MSQAVRRKDLQIYEEAVRPTGPAMTWSMHAIGWAELQEWDKAEYMFNKSYQPYVREPFKVTYSAFHTLTVQDITIKFVLLGLDGSTSGTRGHEFHYRNGRVFASRVVRIWRYSNRFESH